MRLKGNICSALVFSFPTFGFNPSNIPLPNLGDIKSSSPSESPLMEKKELKEAHCPILKQTAKEATAPAAPAVNQSSSDQALAGPEERRVAFDIGDSDELDNKERRVAFDIGDSDDVDCSVTNSGKFIRN